MSADYQTPAVDEGTPVLFYEGGNRACKPLPALVSHAGEKTITVHVLSRETYNFLIRDGVRHLDDPALQSNPYARESGAWDYHPLDRKVRALEAQVAELQQLVS